MKTVNDRLGFVILTQKDGKFFCVDSAVKTDEEGHRRVKALEADIKKRQANLKVVYQWVNSL